MALSESQAATHRRSRARCHSGIQGIHVEAQVNRLVPPRVDSVNRHLYDLSNTIPVNFVHGEGSDVMLPEDGLLASIDVAKTDVGELGRVKMDRVEPCEGCDRLGGGRFAGG